MKRLNGKQLSVWESAHATFTAWIAFKSPTIHSFHTDFYDILRNRPREITHQVGR